MSYPVTLYIYDLSQGMARSLGPALGISDLEGVWHTAIVIHNMEIFFGGSGIEHCHPGATMLGQPMDQKFLGSTNIDQATLTSYLRDIGQSEFHGSRYDLFKHNCNNFSASLARFLGVGSIPQHILDLPDRVLASPIAAMLRPIIEQATPDGQGTSFASAGAGGGSTSGQPKASNSETSFPPKQYSVINPSFDIDKVMAKLIDFNAKNDFKLSDDQLSWLRLLNEPQVKIDEKALKLLSDTLSNWPREHTFPLLNIYCCNTARQSLDKGIATSIYKLIKQHKLLTSDSPATRMCLRMLVNYFAYDSSRAVMLEQREDTISDINTLVEETEEELSPQVENALSSLVVNYAKAIYDTAGGDSEAAFQIVSAVVTVLLPTLKGPEPLWKVIVALATLVKQDADARALTEALDVKGVLAKIPRGRMRKLDDSINECLSLLS